VTTDLVRRYIGEGRVVLPVKPGARERRSTRRTGGRTTFAFARRSVIGGSTTSGIPTRAISFSRENRVRDQLGHSSIQITVDVYGHLVPGGNRVAVDRLDETPSKRDKVANELQSRSADVSPLGLKSAHLLGNLVSPEGIEPI
jgi:integrase